MSAALPDAQVVGGMQKEPHDRGEEAVGFVSNNHGDRGGVRGLKDKTFSGLRGLVGENGILRTRA